MPGPSAAFAVHDIEEVDRPASECYEYLPPQPMLTLIPVLLLIRRKHWLYKAGRWASDGTERCASISMNRP